MVKIEVTKDNRKQINDNHREYIEQTSLLRLEEKISQQNKLYMECKFLKTLFGGTVKRRKECLIDFCLSPDLNSKLKSFDDAFSHTYKFSFNYISDENKPIILNTRANLDYILNYDGFNTGKNLSKGIKWSRHGLITSLGIKVCPYCNRQYITSYEYEENENRTTADADHYYPKAEYPILQMNVFNLIPSCCVCNSRMKGKKDIRHL